ncbi:MAG TPA: TonB-dependent receptor [Gemmatimonadaceae bacterium]|nr:TonB-dependent receptor [Gemmatimonadaceae bacterium]
MRTCLSVMLPLLLLLTPAIEAQRPDSGTVIVTVRESMGMLDGFLVRSEGRTATTDASGRARLVLPAGRRTVDVTRIGFTPKRATVTVVADSTISVTIDVAMEDRMAEMEEVTVSATRTERLAGKTPLRVEVVDEMEVDENTLMAPSGITMLLNETPGLRVQAASPGLGTGSVRILGLPGQYTAMLADGLPLYGGAASALGPLDISPVDLRRVEIIKGAASSLYGAQALGGVINLVSKSPTGDNQLLLNRRTLDVTDAATWMSRRLSSHAGVSLLASGTRQGAADVDDDGWGDQARADRWGVRPRLSWDDSAGRSLFVTAGYGYDDRQGGTLGSALAPDGSPFREGLTGRRTDAGLTLRLPRGDSSHVAARVAFSTNGRERAFGTGPVERDRISTGFAEVTHTSRVNRGVVVVGAAVQGDAYRNQLNDAFDHDWVTPGLFGTTDADLGPVTVSLSVRLDRHPAGLMNFAGELTQTERVAVLFNPTDEWSVRVSGGTGFAPPSSMTEEVEAIGLRAIQPAALAAERSSSGMLDISGHALGAELLVTGYTSSIRNAIQLVDIGDPARSGTLRNAAGATHMSGVEAAAIWRFLGENKFLLTYGYARGSRTNPETDAREPMHLLTRHRAGADLMFEKPGVYRGGIEAIYYGRQLLHNNPYLSASKPYVYTMALAMRQFGPVELVANFENLLNVRMTDYQRLVQPTPGVGGRWTTDVWGPLEGFMANVAVRYRWRQQ